MATMTSCIDKQTQRRMIAMRRKGATVTQLAKLCPKNVLNPPFNLISIFQNHRELWFRDDEFRNFREHEIWFGTSVGYKPKKPKPTRAIPGSPEKIAILRQRLLNGEELFTEGDLRKELNDVVPFEFPTLGSRVA